MVILRKRKDVCGCIGKVICSLKSFVHLSLCSVKGLYNRIPSGVMLTFASILIRQDVPLINVSNFLGHSDLSTTANIYAHLDKASKQASANIITGILNKAKD